MTWCALNLEQKNIFLLGFARFGSVLEVLLGLGGGFARFWWRFCSVSEEGLVIPRETLCA